MAHHVTVTIIVLQNRSLSVLFISDNNKIQTSDVGHSTLGKIFGMARASIWIVAAIWRSRLWAGSLWPLDILVSQTQHNTREHDCWIPAAEDYTHVGPDTGVLMSRTRPGIKVDRDGNITKDEIRDRTKETKVNAWPTRLLWQYYTMDD